MDSLLVQKDYLSLQVDTSADIKVEEIVLDVREDLYKLNYSKKQHLNFIGEKNGDSYVLSVLASPNTQGTYQSLLTTKKGYEEKSIAVSERDDDVLEERVLKVVKGSYYKDINWYYVPNPKFVGDFMQLEEKHCQKKSGIKVGIIYAKAGQVSGQSMLQNSLETCPKSFLDWLEFMGSVIQLDKHQGYRGDMGTTGTTYHSKLAHAEVIYHVSPLLNAEEQRRLVGNDIAIIIYREEGEQKFDPSGLGELGPVPQIFCLIQPFENNYRLAFFSNKNIRPFGPPPPSQLLDKDQAKAFLLSKVHNGLVRVNDCSPMNRLWYVPRSETLARIVKQFPAESKKEKKAREKLEKQEKKLNQSERKIQLDVIETEIFENDTTDYSDINSLVLLVSSYLANQEKDKIKAKVLKSIGFEKTKFFEDKLTDVQGFISADDKKIIIAFGQKTTSKTIQALNSDSKHPFNIPASQTGSPGQLRKSINKGMNVIWKSFFPKLKELHTPGLKIWITGHSTAGAYAILTAFILSLKNISETEFDIGGIYTFGCPKIGDSTWSEYYETELKSKTFRVVNNLDLVPTLPDDQKVQVCHVGQQRFLNPEGKIEKDFEPKALQNSSAAHTIEQYYNALLPHHKAAVELKYGKEGQSKRIYSTIDTNEDPLLFVDHIATEVGVMPSGKPGPDPPLPGAGEEPPAPEVGTESPCVEEDNASPILKKKGLSQLPRPRASSLSSPKTKQASPQKSTLQTEKPLATSVTPRGLHQAYSVSPITSPRSSTKPRVRPKMTSSNVPSEPDAPAAENLLVPTTSVRSVSNVKLRPSAGRSSSPVPGLSLSTGGALAGGGNSPKLANPSLVLPSEDLKLDVESEEDDEGPKLLKANSMVPIRGTGRATPRISSANSNTSTSAGSAALASLAPSANTLSQSVQHIHIPDSIANPITPRAGRSHRILHIPDLSGPSSKEASRSKSSFAPDTLFAKDGNGGGGDGLPARDIVSARDPASDALYGKDVIPVALSARDALPARRDSHYTREALARDSVHSREAPQDLLSPRDALPVRRDSHYTRETLARDSLHSRDAIQKHEAPIIFAPNEDFLKVLIQFKGCLIKMATAFSEISKLMQNSPTMENFVQLLPACHEAIRTVQQSSYYFRECNNENGQLLYAKVVENIKGIANLLQMYKQIITAQRQYENGTLEKWRAEVANQLKDIFLTIENSIK
eukprot:TRINITY_DN3675_c0_g1_i1.p1 TRINITY_DN3675_c0_g1~~TRINITY_DN3675_c0_g1_i1.p1  ORF type:complete len:1217 (+),score=332.61 TRINITY_DN3675_c0_g1_i1:44-3652(+)